jgi:hypothetical protein
MYRRDMTVTPGRRNWARQAVEDSVQTILKTSWGYSQRRVTVVHPTDLQGLEERQKSVTLQSAHNATNLPERHITRARHKANM